jgi:peptide deformylase
MSLGQILKLGNPLLYEKSVPVEKREIPQLRNTFKELHSLILEFRKTYGAGRAIAAPQIGVQKRIICVNTDKTYTMINPVVLTPKDDTMELWDDCMCFPNLLVKVERYKFCTLTFKDENWKTHIWELENDMAELIQHECDHLDGILATQRAVDSQSFKLK